MKASDCNDQVARPQRSGIRGDRDRQTLYLDAQRRHVGARITTREGGRDITPAWERHGKLVVALKYLFSRDDQTGAPMDAARRPAASMNCDDARGRALDKKGDMIGEGHKGTSGLGHDKDLRDDAPAAYGMPVRPLLPARWTGRAGCARRVLPAARIADS